MAVFVLNGTARACLAIVRSLGHRGIKVDVGDSYRINPARLSKYTSQFYMYPDPGKKPREFFTWLIDHIKSHCYEMIFPTDDYTYEVCTSHQDAISEYSAIAVNKSGVYDIARDKEKTIEYALKMNVPVPVTWFPKSNEDLSYMERDFPDYPLILKPAKSAAALGLKKVNNRDELFKSFEVLGGKYGQMLIQEYIPGNDILDVPALFNMQGELRGAMVIKRIRMYPVDGGPNVAGQAVMLDSLRSAAIRLLESLAWRGVAMVEFKIDERDGIPKLMEINPRFWGSTQLAISSGMDFPWMLYEATVEGDCEMKLDYRTDRIVRWLIPGEIMHFLTRTKRRELWPDFFRFFDSNTEYYVFRKDDFMPFWGLFRPKLDMYILKVLLQKFMYF